MSENVKINRGLKGIYFERSAVSHIDGSAGTLSYRGYSIDALATQSTFEEVSYLLIYGDLPTQAELADFDAKLKDARELPLSASFQPPRTIMALATSSSHQQIGIRASGDRISAADAITIADNAKPVKPRTNPAQKQITASSVNSVWVRVSSSCICYDLSAV
jgi:citrate synthase